MTTHHEAIQKMFDRVFQFCPYGKCLYCGHDNLKNVVITPETQVLTKCEKCHRSFVE